MRVKSIEAGTLNKKVLTIIPIDVKLLILEEGIRVDSIMNLGAY